MPPEVAKSKPAAVLVPAVATVVLGALAAAAWVALPRVRELDQLRTLRHADAASPPATPAIYRGRLRGPPGRATPSGYQAAAFWWTVVRRDDDGSEVFCKGRERSDLWLDTPTGTLRIALGEAHPDRVGLVTEDKDDEYDRPIAIDLGPIRRTSVSTLPPSTCDGRDAEYEQLFIPGGTPAEVTGCVRDRVIGECEGPLATTLSVPDLETARRHRLERALAALRVALAVGASILLAAAYMAVTAVLGTARVLRPGKGG